MKEAKRDAAELEEDAKDEAEDSTHLYRKVKLRYNCQDRCKVHLRFNSKLLRQLNNLISANSLEGEEECPICMETLEVDKAIRCNP